MDTTVSLCLILKNEEHNLPRLKASIEGCFDQVVAVDTGSSDNTVRLCEQYGWEVHHFTWVHDFSAARNFSFSKATCDYVAWLDADDSLENPEGFKAWKKEIMPIAEYWLATYHYALEKQTERPLCSFARERVVKRSMGLQWKYFVHEGLLPNKPMQTAYVTNWAVKHHRSPEDLARDKGRNLSLFSVNHEKIDTRMLYYWGKELFENGKHLEGYTKLVEAIKKDDLDLHDRILGIQYAATAAQILRQQPEAIDLAIRGLQIAPTRAEFFTIMGDSYVQMNKLAEAVPYYEAAKNCPRSTSRNQFGFIYTHEHAYGYWPRVQLARVRFQLGDMKGALKEAEEARTFVDGEEAQKIESEIKRIIEKTTQAPPTAQKTTDIVFTCPPGTLYEWDEVGYQTKGYGGSETAAVEMARQLHNLTGRKVIVFNGRKEPLDLNGVSYRPAHEMVDYMRECIPAVCINWRHTERVTSAPTWVWLHDLMAPGLERHDNYDRVLCLSEFHKRYVQSLFGVPEEKIIVGRNGINPARWAAPAPTKSNRVIFPSSPDRGLANALRVMDLVIKEIPDTELHCFYGFENLTKLGHHEAVKTLQQMINERPYVTFHGNVDQKRLTEEFQKSKVWLYPTIFLETFCIGAIEAVLSGCYPVVRNYGALPHTLKGFACDIIDRPCDTPQDVEHYASRVISALREDKWKSVQADAQKLSWASVASEWVQLMGL